MSPPTYTLQITFDRAKNLPVADIRTLSCDPYVVASILVPDAEPLKFRTPTVHRTRDPTWDSTWLVCGVPASGFKLLMTLYDEDPNAKLSVDRQGKALAHFGPEEMKEGYESIEKEYQLQKRRGDLHPYVLTYLSALLPGQKLRKHNRVIASVRVIRKDRGSAEGRGLFTLGPNNYSRHFSPLIGSMVNKRINKDALDVEVQKDGKGRDLSSTTFIANKLQLTGPVPPELRHRFVGYRPFINWMFDDSGIAGRLLYYGLHRQHRSIYKCDKATVWGVIDDTGVNINAPVKEKDLETPPKRSNSLWEPTPESSAALARAFLDMTSWGEGGKLFTYVITLDGEWRFTETGPEFAIDLLSKHSMHADLAKEIAYSGEFFVQRLQGASQNGDALAANGDATNGDAAPNGDAVLSGEATTSGDATATATSSPPARDPKDYELVIDNDSGTYRPKKELLPLFERWLSDPRRLGGLGRVRAMDGFDKGLEKAKEERKKEKAALTAKPGKGKSSQ
ncbi:hypothetical protein FB45DRAFT_926241 [Roridomyces roridus]|uniref:C2 domain-containing protein n=1 Tax=Roridomyces roridus TaxID=1738132 RepID=A0AAD7FK65_9AGAR|nr:hypothetical protein FB45DRAFT_926241 [Roridomyces roridus]